MSQDADWESLLNSDWFRSQPSDVRQLMQSFPFNLFYQEKAAAALPVRIYGIVRINGELRLRAYVMVSPVLCHNIDDGIPPDELERVAVWSNEQRELIEASPFVKMRVLFTEPDGFTLLLN